MSSLSVGPKPASFQDQPAAAEGIEEGWVDFKEEQSPVTSDLSDQKKELSKKVDSSVKSPLVTIGSEKSEKEKQLTSIERGPAASDAKSTQVAQTALEVEKGAQASAPSISSSSLQAPRFPMHCQEISYIRLKTEWPLLNRRESKKAELGENFLDFGIGALFGIEENEAKKVEGWKVGDVAGIFKRSSWASYFSTYDYQLVNQRTKETLNVRIITFFENKFISVVSIDDHNLILRLSNGHICTPHSREERNVRNFLRTQANEKVFVLRDNDKYLLYSSKQSVFILVA